MRTHTGRPNILYQVSLLPLSVYDTDAIAKSTTQRPGSTLAQTGRQRTPNRFAAGPHCRRITDVSAIRAIGQRGGRRDQPAAARGLGDGSDSAGRPVLHRPQAKNNVLDRSAGHMTTPETNADFRSAQCHLLDVDDIRARGACGRYRMRCIDFGVSERAFG